MGPQLPTPITPLLAYEARKAPGGAYHHNIFHQAEHLLCHIRTAFSRDEAPAVLLWPYAVLPWTRALAAHALPHTRVVSTCCGKEKVAAKWWTGERRVCPCWQRVCPGASAHPAAFWPGESGRAAHAQLRIAVRAKCPASSAARGRGRTRVRLLLRPAGSARQLENTAEVLAVLHEVVGSSDLVDVAISDAASLPLANASDPHLLSAFLCAQAAWYAESEVIVSVHGAQTTNAIFGDSGATIIDLQPYAHKPASAAPKDYYEALLENTDVGYITLASERPDTPPRLKGDVKSGGAIDPAVRDDAARCRDDSRCRLAYRDGGNIRVGPAGLRELRRIVSRALGPSPRPSRGTERRLATDDGSTRACTNGSVSLVAVTLEDHHDARSRAFLSGYRRASTELGLDFSVVPAVDGFNTTNVIEELLTTGVPFRNLSKGAKKWGKLAAFLSKVRALRHQVRTGRPFQLTLEDDLHLRPPAFRRMIDGACGLYARHPNTTLVQLSPYTEVMLTSLEGARTLVRLMSEHGIVRSTDQQLLDPRTMRQQHSVRKFLEHVRWSTRPWVLGRAPNAANGFIWKTRRMTWAEMALLRLLTLPGSRALPLHGNPRLPETFKGTGQSGTWAS